MNTTLSMDAEAIAKRLVRAYNRTTDTERVAGLAWYGRAADIVTNMAETYGHPRETIAALIAALSPMNRWQSNLAGAETCLRLHAAGEPATAAYGRTGTVNGNVRKAWRILDGDLAALSGPKVTAFAANLRGDVGFLTLDTWAVRVAVGYSHAEHFRSGEGAAQPGKHRGALTRGYRMAADRVGLPVAHLQAVLWVHIRGAAD
jgi:hypothetical protein